MNRVVIHYIAYRPLIVYMNQVVIVEKSQSPTIMKALIPKQTHDDSKGEHEVGILQQFLSGGEIVMEGACVTPLLSDRGFCVGLVISHSLVHDEIIREQSMNVERTQMCFC